MSREATHIAGWTRTRLGHAFDIELGKMLSPEASVGRDLMPYLANRNVQWNQLDLDDLGYMNFARAERERFRLRSGDLLICEGGEIGRTAIWNDELPECYFQKAIHRLRPRTATIESRLLLHYMRYAVDHNLFPGLIGQTSIAHLTREKLIQFELGHPVSIREQRRITEILDALDDQIAESTCLIAKELSLREGVLRQLSNLYFHATTMSTLAQVSLLITSGSRGWAGYYADHGALFVRIGNLTREHINLRLDDCVFVQVPKTSEGSRAALTPGDILISITADLGIIGMVPEDLGEAYINQHVALIRVWPEVNPRWVAHMLASELGQRQFQLANDSGAKAGLNLPAVGRVQVPIPRRDAQDRLTGMLDESDGNIRRHRGEIAKWLLLKEGLMEDLLTGRVRVGGGGLDDVRSG